MHRHSSNKTRLTSLVLIAAATLGALQAANATSIGEIDRPLNPVWQDTMPYLKNHVADCDNLLAVRLSLMENGTSGALPDCSIATFSESPPLSTYDCTGLTANACAQLYQDNLPHQYMNGGWSNANELWYVPLPDDVAGGNLCIDGTRQFVYADHAVAWQCSTDGSQCTSDSDCGTGVCEAHDIDSNDWIFYTQGGTNCVSGQDCVDKYLEGSPTMTTLGAAYGHDGGGILSDDPRNPFHGHNRVRLRKCTKDAFLGNTTRPANPSEARPGGFVNGVAYNFDLYFHGVREWLAAFSALRNGYNQHAEFAGSCLQSSDCAVGGECVNQFAGQTVNMCRYDKSLPPLSAADSIVLVGWSGGGVALTHTGDRLVEQLQPIAPNATVSLAYDAAWKPGLESDTAFSLGGRNMYLVTDDQTPTAAAPGYLPADADAAVENGADAAFSNESYSPGGATHETYRVWGAVYDESCTQMHGLNSWHCFEQSHVLANHVTAPSFTRMAQRDGSGKDQPGSNHMHSADLCKQDQTEMNCYDWVDEDFRQRTFQQSVDYYRDFGQLGEEGAGAPNRGVFAADDEKHNGLEDPYAFLDLELMQCREDGAELRSLTLSQTLSTWLETGSRVGAIEWREGVAFGDGYVWVSRDACSRCPLVDPAQNFARDDSLSEWDMGMCTGAPGP